MLIKLESMQQKYERDEKERKEKNSGKMLTRNDNEGNCKVKERNADRNISEK